MRKRTAPGRPAEKPSTTRKPALPALDITQLVHSWVIALKSARRSASTLRIYTSSVDRYLQWCDDNHLPRQIARSQVSTWIAELLDNGAQPTSAAARLAGVRQFSKWLADEGEIDSTRCCDSTHPRPT